MNLEFFGTMAILGVAHLIFFVLIPSIWGKNEGWIVIGYNLSASILCFLLLSITFLVSLVLV